MTAAIDAIRASQGDVEDPVIYVGDLEWLLGVSVSGQIVHKLCDESPLSSPGNRNARTMLACFLAEVDEETLQACIADWRLEL